MTIGKVDVVDREVDVRAAPGPGVDDANFWPTTVCGAEPLTAFTTCHGGQCLIFLGVVCGGFFLVDTNLP